MIKQNMEYRSKSDFNLPIFILIFYYFWTVRVAKKLVY